ncbi:glycosyltransferase [Anaeromicropila herbilytica]|uniref:Glycosyl transferase n=1 Tax=Anaeromicropila herbilytica TaxID=2785025 RepID=A0A7R7EIX5_9FIRM|nr:glycosyltransferase [Anaeromicropila herbilytica]BCN29610.1 glycosyl transferase [Anaeromicropila herbilytica]
MITISACLIVKNEEALLGRCLECIKDIVDEIVIVDTGSKDRTKEIAAQYTNKIYDFEWVDDFSVARNYAFSKTSMDYIYTADADEIIDEENQKKFFDIKQNMIEDIEIVQMKYTNQLHFGTTYNYDTEYRPKLFKRIRNFTWIDPIHETIQIEPIIYDSEIEIIHMPIESHAERDFYSFHRILRKKSILSGRLHTMYAKELYISGEDKDFLEAYEYFKRSLMDETKTMDELKQAQCVVARCTRLLGDHHEFFKACLKNIANKASSEMSYEIGEYYYQQEDYLEAILWYYNAVHEAESEMNIHYQGDYSLRRLSECYRRIGNIEEADAYEKLAKEWKVS